MLPPTIAKEQRETSRGVLLTVCTGQVLGGLEGSEAGTVVQWLFLILVLPLCPMAMGP